MHGLQRLREPAVVVLLLVLFLKLVLAVVTLALLSGGPASGDAVGAGFGTVAAGRSALDTLLVVLLVAAVASCVLWSPTRHAHALALAALVLLVLALVIAVVAIVVGLSRADLDRTLTFELVWLLLLMPIPVLGAVVLRRLLATQTTPAGSSRALTGQPQPAEAASQPALAPSEPVRDEPTWQPDQAAGAAWLTAGEAAKGAAATGWGASGDRGGWVPQSGVQRPPGDSTEN